MVFTGGELPQHNADLRYMHVPCKKFRNAVTRKTCSPHHLSERYPLLHELFVPIAGQFAMQWRLAQSSNKTSCASTIATTLWNCDVLAVRWNDQCWLAPYVGMLKTACLSTTTVQ